MNNRPTVKELLITVLGVAAMVGVVAVATLLFRAETRSEAITFSSETAPNPPNAVKVQVRLLSVDPVKGDVSARLQFDPQGTLDDGEGSLTRDVQLDLNSSTGKVVNLFKAGERMNPMDVTVSVYDGSVMDYPFDRHAAELYLELSGPVTGSDGEVASYDHIPAIVEYAGAVAGYSLSASEMEGREAGTVDLDVSIARSKSVLFFALFIMGLQWLLAAVAILAVWVWVVRGNKIEVTMFGWLGALLFALIPLRSAMPGIPAFGALSDMLSFFWVAAIVTVCMVISIATWAFGRARPT